MKYLFLLTTFISTLAFSQGQYLEFKLSSESEGLLGNMKVFAQDGNSRSEMNFTGGKMASFMPKGLAALFLSKEPNKIYMLNTTSKTYTEIITDNSDEWTDYKQSDYEITVIGKEKVNGFNATHVKIKIKGGKELQDMWTSTDIVGYADFAKVKTQYTGKDNLNKALEAKGVGGFPVRVLAGNGSRSFQIDLLKAEKKTLEKNLFTLNGYEQGGLVPGMSGSIDVSKMKDIQNMSPDEQRKAIEELMKQMQVEPK
jgi:hypothetical protein